MAALIFLCLSLSLRAGVNAVTRGAARSQVEEEITCLRSLVVRQWHNLYTKRVALPNGGAGTFLEGDDEGVWYLTSAPVMGITPGGIVAVHLWLSGGELLISQHPCLTKDDFVTNGDYPSHVLMKGVESMRIRYLEDVRGTSLPGDPVWRDEWRKNTPPKGLELTVKLEDGSEIRVFAGIGG